MAATAGRSRRVAGCTVIPVAQEDVRSPSGEGISRVSLSRPACTHTTADGAARRVRGSEGRPATTGLRLYRYPAVNGATPLRRGPRRGPGSNKLAGFFSTFSLGNWTAARPPTTRDLQLAVARRARHAAPPAAAAGARRRRGATVRSGLARSLSSTYMCATCVLTRRCSLAGLDLAGAGPFSAAPSPRRAPR